MLCVCVCVYLSLIQSVALENKGPPLVYGQVEVGVVTKLKFLWVALSHCSLETYFLALWREFCLSGTWEPQVWEGHGKNWIGSKVQQK